MLINLSAPYRQSGSESVPQRISRLRQKKRMSARGLAKAVGLASSSYIAAIEKGEKTPSEDVAKKLAVALGDDIPIYIAWAKAGRYGRLEDWQELSSLLSSPQVEKQVVRADSIKLVSRMTHTATGGMFVPVLAEGMAPDFSEGKVGVVDHLLIEEATTEQLPLLSKPFAYSLSPASAERIDEYPPQGIAIINRKFDLPLKPLETYAVRTDEKVVLSKVWWNEALLVLLPRKGSTDLVTISVATEAELRQRIIGVVAILIPQLG